MLVPVSGGGLISGVAVALKALVPGARVVGVEPEAVDDARRSLRRGEIVANAPRLGDAHQGGRPARQPTR